MKLKTYLETFDKKLNEVTATGAAGTFVGAAGDIVDQLFAGAFHPEFGDIEKLLNQQIDDNIAKRMFNDDITPIADQDFIDMEYKYVYDKEEKVDKSNFINSSDKNMEFLGIDIEYDKKTKYADENFINKSSTNWKYIK